MKHSSIIGIFNYQNWNLRSLENALRIVNVKYEISNIFKDLTKFDKIILPGVGNMKNINSENMEMLSKEILTYSHNGGIIYGICLGLQMLFDYSKESESGTLGLIKGSSISVKESFQMKLNVNFNKLLMNKNHYKNEIIKNLFKDIGSESEFYFLHSYYCDNKDKDTMVINCKIQQNLMPSLFLKKNFLGTQFHPELSKGPGLKFLKNFSDLKIS